MNCALPRRRRLSDFTVRHEDGHTKGRYVIDHGGGAFSELTYSKLGKTQVIADHTGVAPGHEGQGVGQALLEALLADARAQGFRIIPLCPYVNAQRRRHPEWAEHFKVK